jgi:hypothetical protein
MTKATYPPSPDWLALKRRVQIRQTLEREPKIRKDQTVACNTCGYRHDRPEWYDEACRCDCHTRHLHRHVATASPDFLMCACGDILEVR